MALIGQSRLVVLTIGLFFLAALSWGQGLGTQTPPVTPPEGNPPTRSIEGFVVDSKGSHIGNAFVLLKDAKTLQVRSYIAGPDGSYHFYGLNSEVDYELRAQANGMTSKTKTVSVFDSHRVVKLDLKVNKKLKG